MKFKGIVLVLALAAGAFAVAGTGGAAKPKPKPKPVLKNTTVLVSAFETSSGMVLKLSQTTVPRGTVTFKVVNDGKLPHDLSFGDRIGKTAMLEAGQSGTVTIKFLKAGKYTFICTVEGHQEAGMIGVLTVK